MRRYFPYVNENETLPKTDNPFMLQAQTETGHGAVATQFGTASTTQNRTTQRSKDVGSDDDEDEPVLNGVSPIFETFWQVGDTRDEHCTQVQN